MWAGWGGFLCCSDREVSVQENTRRDAFPVFLTRIPNEFRGNVINALLSAYRIPLGSSEVDQAQLSDMHRCHGSRSFVTAFHDDLSIRMGTPRSCKKGCLSVSLGHHALLA